MVRPTLWCDQLVVIFGRPADRRLRLAIGPARNQFSLAEIFSVRKSNRRCYGGNTVKLVADSVQHLSPKSASGSVRGSVGLNKAMSHSGAAPITTQTKP